MFTRSSLLKGLQTLLVTLVSTVCQQPCSTSLSLCHFLWHQQLTLREKLPSMWGLPFRVHFFSWILVPYIYTTFKACWCFKQLLNILSSFSANCYGLEDWTKLSTLPLLEINSGLVHLCYRPFCMSLFISSLCIFFDFEYYIVHAP